MLFCIFRSFGRNLIEQRLTMAEEYKRFMLSAFQSNLSHFVEYNRERAIAPMKDKKTCPHCQVEDCPQKCAKCKGVWYCNKECQISDWPKHKKICKIYQHVFSAVDRLRQSSVFQEFIFLGSSEAMAVILLMSGIEAEVIFCVSIDDDGDKKPIPQVLAGGRFYDITSPFLKHELPGLFSRNIQALPPAREVTANSLLGWAFTEFQMRTSPWYIRHDIDQNDRNLLVKFACRFLIGQHYIEADDKNAILKLYGKYETIKGAMGETTAEFKQRLDEMHHLHDSHQAVALALGRYDRIILEGLPLKEDTCHKVVYCQFRVSGK